MTPNSIKVIFEDILNENKLNKAGQYCLTYSRVLLLQINCQLQCEGYSE